jgi:hypothetical protein
MIYRQALREILSLGFRLHASTSFTDGVQYEARNGRVVAHGEKCYNPDEAMASCYRAVLGKVYG